MELPKLIFEGKSRNKNVKNQKKKVWQISTKVDNNNKKITLLTEEGELGGRLIKKQKEISNIKLSSKKGIPNLEKYAEEEAKKLFNKKKKEGYKEMTKEEPTTKPDNENVQENIINNQNIIEEEIPQREKRDRKKPEIKIPTRKFYPMLANQFTQKKSEVKYPCLVQPKLDGVRCIVVGNRLYSRNGNLFPTLEHIKRELEFNTDNLILDGELYTDDINFEKIVGLVRKSKKSPEEEIDSLKIYLNVFDFIDSNLTCEQRINKLNEFFEKNKNLKYLKKVKTEECKSEEEVMKFLDKYTQEGYEGLIIRNKSGKYAENARSNDLLKLKKFIDEEFEIIDYTTPNIGKEVGCVIWICKTKEGKKFNVRPSGNYKERKNLYRNAKKYIGKMLTVRYQELTNGKVPRFPVGVAIRDYE